MSNESNAQIKDWANKMVATAETTVNSNDENAVKMVVPKETLENCYKESGFDPEAIKSFTETSGNIARAMHFAATTKNIERIKTAVSEGKDYRDLSVMAVGKVNRNLGFVATTKAEKRGEVTRPDKSKVPYHKLNFGSAGMDINAGLPSDLLEEQREETKKIISKSKYYTPDAK